MIQKLQTVHENHIASTPIRTVQETPTKVEAGADLRSLSESPPHIVSHFFDVYAWLQNLQMV